MLQIKVDGFNGIVDVGKFVTKCDLHCTLKNYTEEKKAVFIAERLDGVAFDVYMALTDDEKKDSEVVKKALTDSFDRASRNREVAVQSMPLLPYCSDVHGSLIHRWDSIFIAMLL